MAQLLYPSPARKALITATVMATTLVVTIDMTITVVAVPKMQSSLSASPDQITWVLTSYLIASAIMMPLSGWLASRFGRKLVMLVSAIAFTVASAACGLAQNLEFMVLARMIQGIGGAGMVPLGQATILDINPPEKQTKALAFSGLGAMLGPLAGPTLGGWLTDNFNWHWIFLVNLPIGLTAIAGIALAFIEPKHRSTGKFDWIGFGAASTFIGGLQLMLDRGQFLDWFDSTEICVEAGLAALAFYLLLVHMFTRRDTFVPASLFADRNFALGNIVSMVIGIVVFAASPMMVMYIEGLLGYTPLQFGIINIPRAIASICGILLTTRIIGKVDARLLLAFGLLCCMLSMYLFSRMNLETGAIPILIAGGLQGLAGGVLVSPLSGLAFATLSPKLRNEGAAVFALTRNIGNAFGISVMQMVAARASAQVGSRLAEGVRPDDPFLQMARPDLDLENSLSLTRMVGEISRQATMVATTDSFWMGSMIALATLPVIALMRRRNLGAVARPAVDPGH